MRDQWREDHVGERDLTRWPTAAGRGAVRATGWTLERVRRVLPDRLTDAQAALIEPAAVAVYAVDRGRVAAGSSVLVSGAGPIGALVLLAAKARQLAAAEQHRPLAAYRAAELAIMNRNFSDPHEPYPDLRRAFVYREKPARTPPHLARHRTHPSHPVPRVA